MRAGISPAAPVMPRFSTLATGSGAVLLPCCCSTFFTASAGVGCLRASAGVNVSIGLPSSDASASSTAFMSASGADVAAERVVVAAMSAAPAIVAPHTRVIPSITYLSLWTAHEHARSGVDVVSSSRQHPVLQEGRRHCYAGTRTLAYP